MTYKQQKGEWDVKYSVSARDGPCSDWGRAGGLREGPPPPRNFWEAEFQVLTVAVIYLTVYFRDSSLLSGSKSRTEPQKKKVKNWKQLFSARFET